MPNDRITYGIFTWDFVSIGGAPQLPRWTMKRLKTPGVDGAAFKLLSREAKPKTLRLLAVAADLSDEGIWLANMSDLVGTQARIYSSTSVSYQNVVLTDVEHTDSQKVTVGKWGSTTLGADARILTFDMTVEYPYGYA